MIVAVCWETYLHWLLQAVVLEVGYVLIASSMSLCFVFLVLHFLLLVWYSGNWSGNDGARLEAVIDNGGSPTAGSHSYM